MAQVIFNIVSGRKNKPSFDVLNAIISTNDYIDPGWLLTGKGSMLRDHSHTVAEPMPLYQDTPPKTDTPPPPDNTDYKDLLINSLQQTIEAQKEMENDLKK